MKCYFCESDARGVCTECSRGVCKEHAVLVSSSRIAGRSEQKLVCKECNESSR